MTTKPRSLSLNPMISLLSISALGLALVACGGSESDPSDADDSMNDDSMNDDSNADDPSMEENPFIVDETVEGITSEIVAATDGMTPSDSTVVYNLVWDAPFFHTIQQGFQVAAQEVGFGTDIVTVAPPEWPPTGSLDYNGESADAYISHWAGGIYEDTPVPWVAFEPGSDLSPDLYTAAVTSDNDGISRLLSDLILERLDGKSGKVAVYGAENGPGLARGTGVTEILEDEGYTVVGEPDTAVADDAEKIPDAMTAAFEEHDDIVGVIGVLGFSGGAIASWLEDNDFEPGEIVVVSTDFEAETQDAIEAGYISATTVQRQYWWGYLAGYVAYGAAQLDSDELYSILAPHTNEDNVVTTKFDTVTPENAETYLEFLRDVGVLE